MIASLVNACHNILCPTLTYPHQGADSGGPLLPTLSKLLVVGPCVVCHYYSSKTIRGDIQNGNFNMWVAIKKHGCTTVTVCISSNSTGISDVKKGFIEENRSISEAWK